MLRLSLKFICKTWFGSVMLRCFYGFPDALQRWIFFSGQRPQQNHHKIYACFASYTRWIWIKLIFAEYTMRLRKLQPHVCAQIRWVRGYDYMLFEGQELMVASNSEFLILLWYLITKHIEQVFLSHQQFKRQDFAQASASNVQCLLHSIEIGRRA